MSESYRRTNDEGGLEVAPSTAGATSHRDHGLIGDLDGIDMISGTAQDGPEKFRGFVTVRALAANGDVLIGQLSPEETRAMALRFLETAEAAEQDRIVFTMMTRDVGLPLKTAAGFVRKMREERE